MKTDQEILTETHAKIEREKESSTTLSMHSLLEPVEKPPLMTLAGAVAIGVVTGYTYPSLGERRHSSPERAREPEELSESPHQSLWSKWSGAFDEELDWIKGFGLALFLNTAKDAAAKILPDWEEPLEKVFTRLQKKVEPGTNQPNSTQTEA